MNDKNGNGKPLQYMSQIVKNSYKIYNLAKTHQTLNATHQKLQKQIKELTETFNDVTVTTVSMSKATEAVCETARMFATDNDNDNDLPKLV